MLRYFLSNLYGSFRGGAIFGLLLTLATIPNSRSFGATVAEQVHRVTDLRSDPSIEGSGPNQLIYFNGFFLFVADDGISGQELWRSDGTAAGTQRVRDIYIGQGNPTINYLSQANILGNFLYFTASDEAEGREIWRTDGTEAGTTRVTMLVPGPTSASLGEIKKAGNLIFFSAKTDAEGIELWCTDGTQAGTRMVKDINPGTVHSQPSGLTGLGSKVYFNARDAEHGDELWVSDGTFAGTKMVHDIFSGPNGSNPSSFKVVNDTLFFRANDGLHGQELWKMGGQWNQTSMVRDIFPGSSSSNCNYFTEFNNMLYFVANDGAHGAELWYSDGSQESTQGMDIIAGSTGSNPSSLVAAGSSLYFKMSTPETGFELWKTDGLLSGTAIVKDIRPGSGGSDPQSMTVVGSTIYFSAYLATTGYEFWKTDGTSGGTSMIADVNPGASNGYLNPLFVGNGIMVFSPLHDSYGPELWKTDGTSQNTALIKDIRAGTSGIIPFSPSSLGNSIYFLDYSTGGQNRLWYTDSTASGSRVVLTPPAGSYIGEMKAGGNMFCFGYNDPVSGYEPWTCNPDGTNPHIAADIVAGSGSSNPYFFHFLGEKMIFRATDPMAGFEAWTWNGSTANRIVDLFPGTSEGCGLYESATDGQFIYYRGDDGVHGPEIWKTDGTAANTVMLADFIPGAQGVEPRMLTLSGSDLYFIGRYGSGIGLYRFDNNPGTVDFVSSIAVGSFSNLGRETVAGNKIFFAEIDADETSVIAIWASDGTAAGTVKVKSWSSTTSRPMTYYAALGNSLVFSSSSYDPEGNELWISDGTVSGTKLLRDIFPGKSSAYPNYLTVLGSKLYFSATDGQNGYELWVTDGTEAGTVMACEFYPGGTGGWPSGIKNINNRLIFSAMSPATGNELWSSNGTIADTFMVGDFVPGKEGSNPLPVETAGTNYYFTAQEPAYGREMWVADLTAPAAPVLTAEPTWTKGTQNTVSWPAASRGVSYRVQYSTSSFFPKGSSTVTVSSPSAAITGLSDGTKYWYRAYSRNAMGYTSPWSASVYSSQDAALPTSNISSVTGAEGGSVVTLNWQASDKTPGSGLKEVVVFWKKGNGTYKSLGNFAPGVTTTTFDAASKGGNGVYSFYCVARDMVGNLEAAPVSDLTIQIPFRAKLCTKKWSFYR